jgi:hypothetical protein
VVEGSGNGYLCTVGDYMHINSVRSKLLRHEEPLRSYRSTSLGDYLETANQRPNRTLHTNHSSGDANEN